MVPLKLKTFHLFTDAVWNGIKFFLCFFYSEFQLTVHKQTITQYVEEYRSVKVSIKQYLSQQNAEMQTLNTHYANNEVNPNVDLYSAYIQHD